MTRQRLMVDALRTCLSAMILAALAGGCGYTTERPFRRDVTTVHVEPFASKAFRRRIEMNLTEAIKKRIQMDTPYRLADKGIADTELTGEVLEVRQATLGRDFRSNLPRETHLLLAVRFQWKDLRTGKVLVKRDRWIQSFDYARPVKETEFIALQGAIDRMAETIVEQMEADW